MRADHGRALDPLPIHSPARPQLKKRSDVRQLPWLQFDVHEFNWIQRECLGRAVVGSQRNARALRGSSAAPSRTLYGPPIRRARA